MNTLDVVHDFLRRQVKPGAYCIDATAGKGRDTALLCRLAGPEGRVLAFDVQEEAVAQTRALLDAYTYIYWSCWTAMRIWRGMPRRKAWTASCSTSVGCRAATRKSSLRRRLHSPQSTRG